MFGAGHHEVIPQLRRVLALCGRVGTNIGHPVDDEGDPVLLHRDRVCAATSPSRDERNAIAIDVQYHRKAVTDTLEAYSFAGYFVGALVCLHSGYRLHPMNDARFFERRSTR